MRSPWYRMYTEARNDAKLRTLTDPQHRTWFNLLCYAAEQVQERGTIPLDGDDGILALEVANGDEGLLDDTIKRLIRLHIVARTPDTLTFLHWAERQYDSPSDRPDAVRERVKRHRNAEKREETAVTPIAEKSIAEDSITKSPALTVELDLIPPLEVEIPSDYSKEFEAWWLVYPRKEGKGRAYKLWQTWKTRVGVKVLMKAAHNYADEVDGREVKLVKLPCTFLAVDNTLVTEYADRRAEAAAENADCDMPAYIKKELAEKGAG